MASVQRPTHSDNIAQDTIAERKIAGDGDEEIDKTRCAIAGHNNTGSSKKGVVADFIED